MHARKRHRTSLIDMSVLARPMVNIFDSLYKNEYDYCTIHEICLFISFLLEASLVDFGKT